MATPGFYFIWQVFIKNVNTVKTSHQNLIFLDNKLNLLIGMYLEHNIKRTFLEGIHPARCVAGHLLALRDWVGNQSHKQFAQYL